MPAIQHMYTALHRGSLRRAPRIILHSVQFRVTLTVRTWRYTARRRRQIRTTRCSMVAIPTDTGSGLAPDQCLGSVRKLRTVLRRGRPRVAWETAGLMRVVIKCMHAFASQALFEAVDVMVPSLGALHEDIGTQALRLGCVPRPVPTRHVEGSDAHGLLPLLTPVLLATSNNAAMDRVLKVFLAI